MKIKLLPLFTIAVALTLVVLVVLVLSGLGVGLLPWAGALAGLVAVLQAGQLQTAAPRVRLVLFWAGLATVVLMVAVAWGTTRG